MHRVVILGGGFGGLYAARALRHEALSVTLVDRRNFHLFQPLLYQVATGALAATEIATPLRVVLRKQKNTQVLMADAVDLDAAGHHLILDEGAIPYDTLIVGTGARNTYFGNDSWEAIAPGLKSLEDATRIRHKILYAFEAAEREPDPQRRRQWLTFVVVGAGATGVELAGAMAEIVRDTVHSDFRSIRRDDARILLLDSSPRVLNTFPESLSEAAERQLVRLGVTLRLKVRVTEVDPEGATFSTDGGTERIECRTVLWAAGVRPSEWSDILAERAGAARDRSGRIKVNPDLTIPGHPEIFVVGDMAYLEQDGAPLVGVAPVAMQEGRYAATVIKDRLRGRSSKPFRYFDKGNLAVIGRNAGVGVIAGVKVKGRIAWFVWLFIHLMYLADALNRLLVFVRWGYQYLTYYRGARVITGPPG
ncbi:MAG: FAD-dependent pyridine nucleotide-disulfide oxidoreductase [Bryobacterales bacterium]|jgi:NADH dehydrogenase|nr:FAD-dependent pyridine nucleotide-disulfide oxidoreductase [Bryobacterales bacterium]